MTRKQKRLAGIGIIGAVVGLSVALASFALRDEIVFFFDPTDVLVEQKVSAGDRFRLGGLVADDSVNKNNTIVKFTVTDGSHSVDVSYDGILPDLFREGQGVIAEGILQDDGSFVADTVLAKHDENYVPKELKEIYEEKKSGYQESAE